MLESISSYFTDSHTWAFLVATLLIVVGFVGTVLPFLPGTVLIYTGFLLYGLITGFDLLGWPFYLGELVLVGVSYLVDFTASAYGVKFYGGSKASIWGALLGSLLIFVIGPIGLLVGPLFGAVAGELIVGKEARLACNAGIGTFAGLLWGTILKLAIACGMIGWFVWKVLEES